MKLKRFTVLGALATLGFCSAASAQTEPLTFNQTPISNVVSQLNQKYGINISLKGDLDANRLVTFSVGDPDTPGGRIEAVNALASAMGVDFQKVYVVSSLAPDADIADPKVDTNGQVTFPSTRLPASEAIETVAGVDGASAQVSGNVSGNVVLSNTTLTASSAAAQIAKQTHTQWKTFYAFFQRGKGPARLQGKVIDRTNGGSPIIELPYISYATPAKNKLVPVTGAVTADGAAPLSPPTSTPASAGFGFGGYNPYGGYSPYGGYNPYGGFNPYGGGGSGMINGGGVTVLPEFPTYGGGGPIIIGGY